MQTDNLLGQLNVVAEIVGAAKVAENVDDVLLLAEKLLGKYIALLLAELLSSGLDDLWTLLNNILRCSLALTRDSFALYLT